MQINPERARSFSARLELHPKKRHHGAVRITLALAILCVWLLAGARMRGQQKPDIAVQVKVVNVPVTVHDKHGKIVNNLGHDSLM